MDEMTVTFRDLHETDLPTLHDWLNQPHMKYYQPSPITREATAEKYIPRITGDVPVHVHIVSVNDTPFGKI